MGVPLISPYSINSHREQMRLIRLATIYVDPAPINWEDLRLKFGRAKVLVQKAIRENESMNSFRLLARAFIDLRSYPEITEDHRIVVPENERKAAELAIEAIADLISVAGRCKRSICSPAPTIILQAVNEEEKEWLERSKGMISNRGSINDTHFNIKITPEVLEALNDRIDGVTLLAEALACQHATGRYREFIRFFERAFKLPINQLEKKLTQFLSGAGLGYGRDEVTKWIKLRDAATHADGKKTKHLVLESQVKFIVPRMEQAAYDVLFNKKNWKDSSQIRKNVWQPSYATISDKDIRLIDGSNICFKSITFDEFKAYPKDLSFSLPVQADDLWSKWAPDSEFDEILVIEVGSKKRTK